MLDIGVFYPDDTLYKC